MFKSNSKRNVYEVRYHFMDENYNVLAKGWDYMLLKDEPNFTAEDRALETLDHRLNPKDWHPDATMFDIYLVSLVENPSKEWLSDHEFGCLIQEVA